MERISEPRVAVIGGVNMDIGGSPFAKLVMRDSNPGVITARPGGVGRNIAHDLRLLGMDVSLVAAVGGDVYGQGILESCRELGIDMSLARILPERRSSTYLYVTDETGDMQIGIADMEITECITPEYLESRMEEINRFDAVVLDANLSAESVEYAVRHCAAPIIADPVSTAKAARLAPVLDRLWAIKPNIYEAEKLTGEHDPEKAAAALLDKGVKRVFISLGEEGMLAAERGGSVHMPRELVTVVNTTGAGDAATSAIVWAALAGLDIAGCARAAVKAGAITACCEGANNPELCAEKLG